jgi:hypothetical protein
MPVCFKLAIRNLFRHPRQTLTLGFVVAVGIGLLFIGNSLLDGTDAGIEESSSRLYRASFGPRRFSTSSSAFSAIRPP